MKKTVQILESLVPIIMALGIQLIVQLIQLLLYRLIFRGAPVSDELHRYMSIISVGITGVILYNRCYVSKLYYGVTYHERKLLAKDVLLIVVMGVGCQLFLSGIMTLISPLFTKLFEEYGKTIDSIHLGNPFIIMLYVTIIAPITEELIFRGLVLTKALRILSPAGAIILQAVAFGVFHGNVIQGFFTFLIGVILGGICYRYKTIYAPIILHMVLNASTYFIRTIEVNVATISGMIALGGALVGLSIWLVLKNTTRNVDEYGVEE